MNPRAKNPREPVFIDRGVTDYEDEWIRFVFDNLDGSYQVLRYEDNVDKNYWDEFQWDRVHAVSPQRAAELTDVYEASFVGPPDASRKFHKLPKWVEAHVRPQTNPSRSVEDFVVAHAQDTTWQQRIPGGTTKPPRAFNPAALVAGTLVELEHTTDPAIAMEITMDHLDRDPKHYDREIAQRRRNPGTRADRAASLSRRLRST